MSYKEPELAVLILDFRREQESKLLLNSLRKNLQVNAKLYYLSNSPEDYVYQYVKEGLIDVLIVNKENLGCGIGTRQLFHASLSKYSLYCQVDQWLIRPFTQDHFNQITERLNTFFYADLAGNQGNGQFSERAFLIETQKYLEIPGIDSIIGSPGPFANYRWGEKHVQDYMSDNYLRFFSTHPFFGDNGRVSYRTYPCGGETLHYTDTKQLFIIKQLKKRYDDFPNLKLTDSEWNQVLSGTWEQGNVPEMDKQHSFKYYENRPMPTM